MLGRAKLGGEERKKSKFKSQNHISNVKNKSGLVGDNGY